MDAVEEVAAAAPTADTVEDLRQQVDALKTKIDNIDGEITTEMNTT